MTEITISEIARKIYDLPAGKKLYFRHHVDHDLFGVIKLDIFECDSILISRFGGHNTSVFDATMDYTPKGISSWVQDVVEANEYETVFLMEESEVYPRKHELWGITFRTSNDDGTTYRTLAISEIPLFPSREKAEKWISDRPEGPFDSAFPAKICDEPKAVLIDQWEENINN